jgi:predicted P-loop ATPase
MADDMNFFDQTSATPKPDEPPPPASEADYGDNVVTLTPKGKRGQPGWKSEWHLADSGSPLPTLHNAMITLRNHPTLSGLLRYDEMSRSALVVQQIPGTPHDPSIPRHVKDADVISIQEEIQRTGLRRIAKATVQDAVHVRAEEGKFHPVHDYLNGLVWDGETRVTGWLSRYLGVEGCPYADTIGRLFLVALVARQFRPGCKADYMLILEGPQGAMKSSACRALAGEWFSDNLPDLSRGDAVRLSMHLRGKWLIEIAEMSSFNSAEAHTLKEFLTQTEERYTPKYGRNEVYEPRQCVFIGSTNEGAYLRDATGARRFWPVKVGAIDIEALIADRDQLLAEAVKLFRDGAAWWPDRAFEVEHIAPQQDARYEADPWHETIEAWLRGGVPVLSDDGIPINDEDGNPILSPQVSRCTAVQILRTVLSVPIERISPREQKRVSGILTKMGWIQKRTKTERLYLPPTKDQSLSGAGDAG